MTVLVNPYRFGPPPAAPTFFAAASNPADLGTLTGATVSLTPPASMVAGDLVVVALITKQISLTWAVTTTGGQTWNTSAAGFGASLKTCALYWCTFNGTWAANPVFTCATASSNSTGVMNVFRPDLSSRVWAVDVAFAQAGFGAPSSPFTVSIAGLTTVNQRTVAFASWWCSAANTYANLVGAGWVSTPTAQYRNGATAMSHAYALNGPSGVVVPSVSKDESASTQNQVGMASWYAS